LLTSKTCSTCKLVLPVDQFYPHRRMRSGLQSQCKKCSRRWHLDRPDYVRAKNKEYRRKNPTYARDYSRNARHGVTREQAGLIRFAQKGLCAGCLEPLAKVKECLDHCHKTGQVRGLLCDHCNAALGRLKDSSATARRLADYLDKYESQKLMNKSTRQTGQELGRWWA